MALNLQEADRMVEAAQINGVKLCVVHNELFLPVVTRARSMVERGLIGDVVGISITDSVPRERGLMLDEHHWCHKLPGGIFGEMLPHPLYIAVGFLGGLELVAVHSRKLGKYEWVKADELRVILEGKNGLAMITESVNWPKDYMVLDVFGTKASIHVDIWGAVITSYGVGNRGFNQWYISEKGDRGWQNVEMAFQRLVETTAATLGVVAGRYRSGHYTLIQRFIESIQNGTEMPVTAEEGREVVRLLQAITSQIDKSVSLNAMKE